MPTVDLNDWSRRLIAAGTRVLGEDFLASGVAGITGFCDEFGSRPAVADPLVAAVLGVAPGPLPAGAGADVRLWHALHQHAPDVRVVDNPIDGPLLELPEDTSIEVRTEAELSALHALDRLAVRHGRDDWARRAAGAAHWHVRNMQPDNATNHPWAVQVFLKRAANLGEPESRMFAETLLHNCQVSMGRPDRLSAVILVDAGRALQAPNRP